MKKTKRADQMHEIILRNTTENGLPLEAIFAPLQGMNLLSFKKGTREALDQTTKELFTERCAGLGALIGPHFHHRPLDKISHAFDASLFPHIAKEFAKGIQEPFTHGIARYVPWTYEHSETQIHARLRGADLYKGTPIRTFEGQDFEMTFVIKLVHDGLILQLSIQSEFPSLVGFHYYYHHTSPSYVQALVKKEYRDQGQWKALPSSWYDTTKSKLHFDLRECADFGFQPLAQPDHPYYLISLKSSHHLLHVEYTSSNDEEISWQLYHPKEASFACIEPLSTLNPIAPTLTNSNLYIKIGLF